MMYLGPRLLDQVAPVLEVNSVGDALLTDDQCSLLPQKGKKKKALSFSSITSLIPPPFVVKCICTGAYSMAFSSMR